MTSKTDISSNLTQLGDSNNVGSASPKMPCWKDFESAWARLSWALRRFSGRDLLSIRARASAAFDWPPIPRRGPNALDKIAPARSIRRIHQGSPGKGLRYCWLSRRSDPLNLIQFILA